VEQHCIAIRRSAPDVEAPDRAIAAGTVLNEELNIALGLDLGCNEAREGVDASTRRYGNDNADWAIGKTACARTISGAGTAPAVARSDKIASRRFVEMVLTGCPSLLYYREQHQ
jgi:hypothetical protein